MKIPPGTLVQIQGPPLTRWQRVLNWFSRFFPFIPFHEELNGAYRVEMVNGSVLTFRPVEDSIRNTELEPEEFPWDPSPFSWEE